MTEGQLQTYINSSSYWDKRFTADWEECRGREQTKYFGEIALGQAPKWFLDYLLEEKLSICDFGCALGDATVLLQNYFKSNPITGLDISTVGINKAKKTYPSIDFEARDLLGNPKTFDVVFSSNTLEYFHDALKVLEKLTQSANCFIWLLLPFYDDSRIDEPFYFFNYDNIPFSINNKFHLIYCKPYLSHNEEMWDGHQVSLIYATEEMISTLNNKSFSTTYPPFLYKEIYTKLIFQNEESIIKLEKNLIF